jgi:hypothetical protein
MGPLRSKRLLNHKPSPIFLVWPTQKLERRQINEAIRATGSFAERTGAWRTTDEPLNFAEEQFSAQVLLFFWAESCSCPNWSFQHEIAWRCFLAFVLRLSPAHHSAPRGCIPTMKSA